MRGTVRNLIAALSALLVAATISLFTASPAQAHHSSGRYCTAVSVSGVYVGGGKIEAVGYSPCHFRLRLQRKVSFLGITDWWDMTVLDKMNERVRAQVDCRTDDRVRGRTYTYRGYISAAPGERDLDGPEYTRERTVTCRA